MGYRASRDQAEAGQEDPFFLERATSLHTATAPLFDIWGDSIINVLRMSRFIIEFSGDLEDQPGSVVV